MYKLSLNNEELLSLRDILERIKIGQHNIIRANDPTINELLSKVTLAQIDVQEQDEAESQAERYAANLHAMPEGS